MDYLCSYGKPGRGFQSCSFKNEQGARNAYRARAPCSGEFPAVQNEGLLFLIASTTAFFRAFSVPELLVVNVLVEKLIDLIHIEVGNDLAKFIDLDIKPLQLLVDFRFSFFWFFL